WRGRSRRDEGACGDNKIQQGAIEAQCTMRHASDNNCQQNTEGVGQQVVAVPVGHTRLLLSLRSDPRLASYSTRSNDSPLSRGDPGRAMAINGTVSAAACVRTGSKVKAYTASALRGAAPVGHWKRRPASGALSTITPSLVVICTAAKSLARGPTSTNV